MTIPLDIGFTVVTGPNGSGKSNILDGILFCLGLASSRGMRADRLPDLVNSGVLKAGKSSETVVSVRFDLSDWQPDVAEEGLEPSEDGPWIKENQKDWTVTRKLRIMPGGSYSSSYFADGEPCNLQQLQTQLRRLRVDPEGSNVVMQGDVTRIVSMSNKDRRGLIDELAGVALFDSRIEQTRLKLNEVQERQERCQIVEQELLVAKNRLEKDCEKARVYKELKQNYQIAKKQELVLTFEEAQKELVNLKNRHQALGEKDIRDSDSLAKLKLILGESVHKLKVLQQKVKDLGEDQLLSIQAEVAGLDTQSNELDRQALIHKKEGEELQLLRKDLINRNEEIKEEKKNIALNINPDLLHQAEKTFRTAEAAVEASRRRLAEVAGRSGAWIDDQRQRSIAMKNIQDKLNPLKQEHQKFEESLLQLNVRLEELETDKKRDNEDNKKVHEQLIFLESQWEKLLKEISQKKKEIQEKVEELSIQEKTRYRLEQEQTRIEKDIARMESRRDTLQESRGQGALRLLLEAGLDGIHGPVAQLGEVDDSYRQALEVAAGGRLAQVVVENDRIAAKAIELLKRRKAGRLTFLPLNKIKKGLIGVNKALKRATGNDLIESSNGFIGKAFDLIKFEEIYEDVFSYVFGDTLVFRDLNSARIHLGIQRAVTLDGELLEKNGAMTGGSFSNRSIGLSFGSTNERDELEPLRQRLLEVGETLSKCQSEEANLNIQLSEARSELLNLEQQQVVLDTERTACKRSNGPLLEKQNLRCERFNMLISEKETYTNNLTILAQKIEPLVLELTQLSKKEQLLQKDQDADNWKQLQTDLEVADSSLGEARLKRDHLINEKRQNQFSLERLEDQTKSLLAEEIRLKNSVETLSRSHKNWKEQIGALNIRRTKLEAEQKDLEMRFGEQRRERDLVEVDVANQRQKLQETQWNLDRLRDERQSLEEELRNKNIRLQELEQKLPAPLPDISDELRQKGLEALQAELENLQRRMEALEPVNMLALEELGKLEKRLEDLVNRLQILSEERSELLLRIETVATLRQEAFMEAFEAVDVHFREIFASLSEGDGHLQLDNPGEPLEGGLTLVAHPKGKSVRRLAAMSGGEKSLTALSFLFALQRFRPSPFYALDEVDSFLDGVNVERLSALIAKQADDAQFLVVSHRRPMIGASSRTIGVTQARGAHTQVVGMPIAA